MEYLVKNKKCLFFIFFLVLALMPLSASAMVKKDTIGTQPPWTTRSKNGQINSGSWGAVSFPLNSNLTLNANFDYIGIQLNNSEFIYDALFEVDNPYLAGSLSGVLTCAHFDSNHVCDRFNYQDNTGSFPQVLSGSIEQGDMYHYYVLMNATDGYLFPCFFSSEMDEVVFCPTKNNGQPITMTGITFYLGNKSSSKLNYYITLDDIKTYYNENSTEIINALNGVSTNVSATTSAIEAQTQQQAQQNAYVQNSNISQAQTNTTTSITTLNDQLTAELSQFSDLTQLVLAPITIFMELNNNVCAPLTLQIPFVGGTAVIPCMKPVMQQHFGTMYSVFTTVIGAILCYWTFVRTVALIKDLVDADNDKIEVVDL